MADKTNMVQSAGWRDRFKIDDKILKMFWEEFSQNGALRSEPNAAPLTLETASDSVEFVLWCVTQGHFSEEDFTRFHSEQSKLPTLRGDFFSAPVDRDFWERVKDLHPWSSHCVPLAEWDGHLLVGSVWPGERFKSSLRHLLVLATPSELRAFHEKFVPPVVAAIPTPKIATPEPEPVIEEEAPLDPSDPFAALSRELARLNQTSSDASVPTESEAEPSDVLVTDSEAPEGLVIPEGLSFGKDEISRLMGESSEASETPDAGTLVHNFETGEDNIVERKPEDSLTPEEISAPASELELQPPVLEKNEEATPPPAVPKKVAAPPPPPAPSMPFAVNAAPPPPQVGLNFKLETPATPPPPPEAPIVNSAASLRPAAEATVVIEAAVEPQQSPAPKTDRRPLFEPAASKTDGPAVAEVSKADATQTGTKSRKLEATPVMNVINPASGAMGGAAARLPNMKPGRNPDNYLTRIITVNKIEPLHLDECVTIDEAGAQAILQACNIFETSMILLFKDGLLQPWKWNDLFLSVNGEKPESIDLTNPSLFKIVFRTAKPYHGYVVTNPVNQKFFNEFNRGMLPKHATIIPIMIDGRMGGMTLGFTNSKIDYRQSLRLMERLSSDLGRVFKKLRGTMAKAS